MRRGHDPIGIATLLAMLATFAERATLVLGHEELSDVGIALLEQDVVELVSQPELPAGLVHPLVWDIGSRPSPERP